MPHPKRRQSSQRTNKRRTHYKAKPETISTDPVTGESHLRHRAHWHEGSLVYKGQVIFSKAQPETEETDEQE